MPRHVEVDWQEDADKLNLFSTPQWVVCSDPPLHDILCRTSERSISQVYS
jgi:hypothetical protein